jgi:DNA-binding NtrC family response regulator
MYWFRVLSPKPDILWIQSAENPPAGPLPESLEAYTIRQAPSVPHGLSQLEQHTADVVMASFPQPGWTPAELLEAVQEIGGEVPVLILDPAGTPAEAVRLARLGAYQVVGQPADFHELARHLEAAVEEKRSRELARLNSALTEQSWRRSLVGDSRPIERIAGIIRLAGPRRCTVLITGETGTGKELVARALHMASPRRNKPLVIVNCSALPEHLLEAELFGHVKGAFTGASGHRVGRLELADGGTLFLDEIGDMPLNLQPKLLRVLQEREFQRLGSSETVRVDLRVVAATNSDLLERVRKGAFREDLYYRLNVVPVETPPLRQRLSDVPLLVRHFIEKVCRAEGLPLKHAHRETIEALCRRPWPGNVRQLENAVEVAVVLSGDRTLLRSGDFPLPKDDGLRRERTVPAAEIEVPDCGFDYERTVGDFERSILRQALAKAGGNKRKAADMLRLKRTTLSAKLRVLETRAAS